MAGSPAAAGAHLAQTLAQHADEAVVQGILLVLSLRPHLREHLLELMKEPPGSRYQGRIKSFWADKKFGFIACPELHRQFGSDVFLSDQEIGCFGVGCEVTFSIMLNKDGRPQAKLLQDASIEGHAQLMPSAQPMPRPGKRSTPEPSALHLLPGHAASPPPMVPPMLPPARRVRPKFEQAPQEEEWDSLWDVPAREAAVAKDAAAPTDDAADPEELYMGTIKNFWPTKRYGFIDCGVLREAHGGDVFLSNMEIQHFKIGDQVMFTVTYNKNGRPQAHGLRAALPAGDWAL